MFNIKSFFDRIAYGQMALPLAFAGFPLYIIVPDFYATEHGLSLFFIGMALLAIRFFDAVIDPLIGFYSDRYAQHRIRILIAASVIFGLSFVMMFHPLFYKELWFVISLLCATAGFSIIYVNYNSAGSLVDCSDDHKKRLFSTREAMMLVGLMMAMILPFVLNNLSLYAAMVFMLSIVSVFIFKGWYNQQKLMSVQKEDIADHFSFSLFKKCLKPPFRGFFKVYALSMLASSLPAVTIIFYVRDYLGAYDQMGLFLCVYFIAAILSIPLWRLCANRYGEVKMWFLSIAMAFLFAALAYFIKQDDVYYYVLYCALSGIAFGGEVYLPSIILSQLINKNNQSAETAFYFGGYAFVMKLMFAVASAIVYMTLHFVGFAAEMQNTTVALTTVVLLYTLIPAVIKIISLFALKYGGLHENNLFNINGGMRHVS